MAMSAAAALTAQGANKISAEELGNTTTLMFLFIPRQFTGGDLVAELERHVSKEAFDCFYVPWDRNSTNNMGYAFANFVEAQTARMIHAVMNETLWPNSRRGSHTIIVPARMQGLAESLQRYSEGNTIESDFAHCPQVFRKGRQIPVQIAIQTFCRTAAEKPQMSTPFAAPPGLTLVPQTVLMQAPEENSSNASTDETVLKQAPEENSSNASTDDNVSPAHPQESWEGSCNGTQVGMGVRRLFSISQCLGSSSSSTGSNRSSAADSLRPQQQPAPKQVANTVVDKTSEILSSQGYAKSWIEVNMLLNRLQQKGIF
eukprot:CAMPEP_0204110028 /NCGR_PEP_ID=MMETSP0361-20130328/1647_1 /ASSEMBLY_ACC=CAM_ASM_000343 /TAXON_ID=268821 /ORGANISM="Scrippsiella Hangoei, Strain SHTV-5" /LENGTH=314 /DNA_ID=CAMNT_0051059883 /DNA_START=60 /DNA_END=1004 /DNA_ORIENTATION=-